MTESADQGREGGGDRCLPPARDGHGIAAGTGRDPDGADQRAHRAPEDAQEGPSLAARAAADGRAPAPAAELPAARGPGRLPRAHAATRPAQVARPARGETGTNETEGRRRAARAHEAPRRVAGQT